MKQMKLPCFLMNQMYLKKVELREIIKNMIQFVD